MSAEVTLRNNTASATTPVLAPDSVRVDASYLAPSFRMDISLDAISGRSGEDPDGALIMDLVRPGVRQRDVPERLRQPRRRRRHDATGRSASRRDCYAFPVVPVYG